MVGKIRKTGIDVLGDVHWGTHVCQFFQTKGDLINILVPYFKSGLKNNEFCIWVTSEPFDEKEAKEAMRKAMSDFDRYLKRGQIEIVSYTRWYLKDGVFNPQKVLDAWIDRLNQALAKGYDGMRVTGNAAWLGKKDWNNFTEYEAEVNSVIGKYRMMAICTYSLDKCSASEILDVTHNHQFALIRSEGKWEIIESRERERVEKLRRSEASLAEAQRIAHLGNWDWDIVKNELRWSDEIYRIFGLKPQEFGATYEAFLNSVHPDDREFVKKSVDEALFQRKYYSIDHRIVLPDASERIVHAQAEVFLDKAGMPIRMVGTIQDITGRKRTEEELRLHYIKRIMYS